LWLKFEFEAYSNVFLQLTISFYLFTKKISPSKPIKSCHACLEYINKPNKFYLFFTCKYLTICLHYPVWSIHFILHAQVKHISHIWSQKMIFLCNVGMKKYLQSFSIYIFYVISKSLLVFKLIWIHVDRKKEIFGLLRLFLLISQLKMIFKSAEKQWDLK